MPAGPGDIGKVYAVAMSPDGAHIAVGGWTRWTTQDPQEQIVLFTRDGTLVERIEGLPGVVHHLTFSRDGRYLAAGLVEPMASASMTVRQPGAKSPGMSSMTGCLRPGVRPRRPAGDHEL